MSISRFEELVNYILGKGYSIMSLKESLTAKDKNVIAFTFDDGYKNNMEAFDVLSRYNQTGTIYIATDYIGSTGVCEDTNLYPNRGFLDREDILKLHNKGHEIASHGTSHNNFGKMTLQESNREFLKSKEVLEHIIGTDVIGFAFPNGQRGAFNNRVIESANKIGFAYVATTVWGKAKKTNYVLNRCEIASTDSIFKIKMKLKGLYVHRFIFDRLTLRGSKWL